MQFEMCVYMYINIIQIYDLTVKRYYNINLIKAGGKKQHLGI